MQAEDYRGPLGVMKESFTYLCDSGTEYNGVKFWGSPWSLWFKQINPECMAFTGDEKDLEEYYAKIPDDTDILITHSPPWGVLDEVKDRRTGEVRNCGSKALRTALDRVKPLYIVFGHIHENGGKKLLYKHAGPNTVAVNVSHVNHVYQPTHKPTRIYIPVSLSRLQNETD